MEEQKDLEKTIEEINDWVEDPLLVLEIVLKGYGEFLGSCFEFVPPPPDKRSLGKVDMQPRYRSKNGQGIKPPRKVKEAVQKARADIAIGEYALGYWKNKEKKENE